MNVPGIAILLAAPLIYGMRLGGLLLGRLRVPPRWERILAGVPTATLSALAVEALLAHPLEAAWRWPAVALAAAAVARWPRMEVGLLAGMAAYAALRWL